MHDNKGRAPDVSEQRAEALYTAVERGATALCRFVFPGYLVPRIEMARAVIDAYNDDHEGWMDRLPPKRVYQPPRRPQRSDPASVLAALLAEQPDATIAALETLLTSDEAVDHTLDEMMRVFVAHGPNFARLNPTDMRLVALRLSRAPSRSLRPKAPKEDRDA